MRNEEIRVLRDRLVQTVQGVLGNEVDRLLAELRLARKTDGPPRRLCQPGPEALTPAAMANLLGYSKDRFLEAVKSFQCFKVGTACELLDVTEHVLRNGEGPICVRVGNRRRYTLKHLITWALAHPDALGEGVEGFYRILLKAAPSPEEEIGLYTTSELVELISVSDAHLGNLRKRGLGPVWSTSHNGGRFFYEGCDIRKWIEKGGDARDKKDGTAPATQEARA